MKNTHGPYPGRKSRRPLSASTALVLACCLLLSSCGSKPDTPEPSPSAAPIVTPGPTGSGEPAGPKNPVNGEVTENLSNTLLELYKESDVLTPMGDGSFVYEENKEPVVISVCDPEEAEAAMEAQPTGDGTDTPAVVTGVMGDTSYLAVTREGTVTVYITAGKQTVKAETSSSGKTDTGAIKKAASVAGSVVKAARAEEGYVKGRDDYDHNPEAYYMPHADCLVFYPAQLTKKTAFEDQSVIFADSRSSVTCSVRLERNPYRDMDELDSLIRNSEYNTVLGWGDNWMTSETVKDGIVTFSYTGLGKTFMVTAELCYPRKYSFVFDELRELISVRFLEGAKWVNGNRPMKQETLEYGAPICGITEYFYPEHDLRLVLPDTLNEQAVLPDRIVFHDSLRDGLVTVYLYEVPEYARGNLFKAFAVFARDGDVLLGNDWVQWHNESGMYLGALAGTSAALVEFEGADAFTRYEGIYRELLCRLTVRYYEDQPLSGQPDPEAEHMESQQTEATPAPTPEPTMESQPTSGTPAPTPPADGTRPLPGNTPPKAVKAESKPVTNELDKVVEKKVKEKAAEVYPAPETGNDPLLYYSDADCRAVNTSLKDWEFGSLYGQEMILEVIQKVLLYNGYAEAGSMDAVDLWLKLDDQLELLFGDYNPMDEWIYERMPTDLFPYVTEALGMDKIPEYRVRPISDPPAPEWLKELRETEGFDEEELDWNEIRKLLDAGESIDANLLYDIREPEPTWEPEPTEEPEPTWEPEPTEEPEPDWESDYAWDSGSGWYTEGGPYEPDAELWSGGDLYWEEYDIRMDAETIEATCDFVDKMFWYYNEQKKLDNYEAFDGIYVRHRPVYERAGELPERMAALYRAASLPEDWETDDGYAYWLALYQDGLWAIFDGTGALVDYGFLIPDDTTYWDLYYTRSQSGKMLSLWEFDYGIFFMTDYGSFDMYYGDED